MSIRTMVLLKCLMMVAICAGCEGKPLMEVWRWDVYGEDVYAIEVCDSNEKPRRFELPESERTEGVRFLSAQVKIATHAIWRQDADGSFTFPLHSFVLMAPGVDPIPAWFVSGVSKSDCGYSDLETQRSKTGEESSFQLLFAIKPAIYDRTDLSLRFGTLPPLPLNQANRFEPILGNSKRP